MTNVYLYFLVWNVDYISIFEQKVRLTCDFLICVIGVHYFERVNIFVYLISCDLALKST